MGPSRSDLRKLSRRRLLAAGGALATAASLSGCDALSTTPSGGAKEGGDRPRRSRDKESPALADRVRTGKLPHLKDRLPEDPLVVRPVDKPGPYGGELHSAILGPSAVIQLDRIVGYDCLMRWTPDWKPEPIPNIAKSIETNSNATTFTIRLRPGTRWSSGAPFDADDIVFAQNDVLGDRDLYPAAPSNPVTAEKLDRHTVRLKFDNPNSLFIQEQASTTGLTLITKPMHYLKQFHKKYNPDVDALVDKSGQSTWTELFLAKAELWSNPDLPTLAPWVQANGVGKSPRLILERNPYYWKVDQDGRQLPYIDKVVYTVSSEAEVILTKVMHGDIDFQLRPSNTLANKPVLARNRAKGKYDFAKATPSNMNTMAFCFNLTHSDPVLRNIFRDKRFRIGLSHAINRKELIDTAYQKQGEPFQCAPRPESDLYDETFAKQYTAYDPARAKSYLDKVLPNTDEQGFRQRSDGDRLSITVEFALGIWPEYPDVLQLIKGYWKHVGVDLIVKGEDRSLFDVRTKEAQKHEAAVWQGAGGWNDMYVNPYYYLPVSAGATYWGYPWWQWYLSDGKDGEEPPDAPKEQIEIWRRLQAAPAKKGRSALMKQILDIAREEFYVLGINLQPEEYATVSNRLHNVPKALPNSWVYPTPGPTNPGQYYIEE